MPRPNLLMPLAALGLALLFFAVLMHILLLRYEKGNVYPAYSTLRADPLGTRVFYEALEATGRYQASRGFSSLHRELATHPNGLIYLGLSAEEVLAYSPEEVTDLDQFVRNGGRVIMTFSPEAPREKEETNPFLKPREKKTNEKADPQKAAPPEDPGASRTQEEKWERQQLKDNQSDENGKDQESKDDKDSGDTAPEYHQSLAALWGFGWKRHEEEKAQSNSPEAKAGDNDDKPEVLAERTLYSGIEAEIPWKSAVYFVRLEPEWHLLYLAKDQPVVVRRSWGRGEILLATDSYFLSNEALRNSCAPQLLNLMAGWPGRLLFDEAHLGTEEQKGLVALARKFRVEGFFYGMLVVLGLFLWRNSSPLVPPHEFDRGAVLGGTVSGKDSRGGLVNLLRRNIAPRNILGVCFQEWKKGVTPNRPHLQEKQARMEAVLAGTAADPSAEKLLQAYHELRLINSPEKAQGIHGTKH